MRMDRLIEIQEKDEETEIWASYKKILARINSARVGESYSGGGDASNHSLVFEVRYLPDLEPIRFDTGRFRIVYMGHAFNITGYDDYFEEHGRIRLTGESYGDAV